MAYGIAGPLHSGNRILKRYSRLAAGHSELSATAFLRCQYTASQDISPYVNWLILGSKLPGMVLPEHRIDLRLWLAWAVDLGEMFLLAVK